MQGFQAFNAMIGLWQFMSKCLEKTVLGGADQL
jgi:hypothetical protein